MIHFHCPKCGHKGEDAFLRQNALDRITFNSTSTSDYDIMDQGHADPGEIVCPECFHELSWEEEKTCLIIIEN